ncbi:glycoside hydrolase family 43 protein [Aquipuribacter sp. MA13-6]|uniref:glycoside hydrolase family 43 protein n=1 Tax=unclassified Aquipuribacter TaxID=2635084 RepID=UPI003EE8AA06
MSTQPGTRTYRNPVVPGFHPDPSVCRVGDVFYLVTSSFEYFPGIPVLRSTDLVHWQQLGHVLTRTSQLDLRGARASGGVYAPTIRWHDGTFYVTATDVSGGGHLLVHAQDPAGPWSDPVPVDQDGIDPSLFRDVDGTWLFTSTAEPVPGHGHEAEPGFTRGVQQSVVDPLTGERRGDVRFLWAGTGGRFPEAPHLYRRGRWYHLLLAEGGTEPGHMVTVARSTSPWGPWQPSPHNPVVSHRSSPHPLQSVGHADLVELADGTWWAVLLGTRPVGGRHHLGRETLLAPVTWPEDGWPSIGVDGRVPLEHPAPDLPPSPADPASTVDEFDGPTLPPRWSTLRRPLTDAEASLTASPGALTLRGGPDSTDDPLLVAVLRRQQHVDCSVVADLDVDPVGEDEAGLLVRMDEDHHVELAVRVVDGHRRALVRNRVGPLQQVTAAVAVDPGPLRLRVDADAEAYRFSVEHGEARRVDLGAAPVRYLSTEVAGGFTGVHLGVYASGNGAPARGAARWTRFAYTAGRAG